MTLRERIQQFKRKRIFALFRKEVRQIFRDKQLLSFLLIPPIVQILAYGYALSPEVEHLRLAILNQCPTPTSRELISALVENRVFDIQRSGDTETTISEKLRVGDLDAAVIIPPQFQRQLAAGKNAPIQVLLDAVDANTAGIANGYIVQMVSAFNARLRPNMTAIRPLPPPTLPTSGQPSPTSPPSSAAGAPASQTQPAPGGNTQNPLNTLRVAVSNQAIPPSTTVKPLFNNSAAPVQIANASASLLNSVVSGTQASGASTALASRVGNSNGFNTILFDASDTVDPSALSFTAPPRGSAVDTSQTASLTTQRPIASTVQGPNSAVYPNAVTGSDLNSLILNSVTNTEFSSRPLIGSSGRVVTNSTALPGALSALGTTAQNGLSELQMFSSPQLEISEALFPLTSISPGAFSGSTRLPDLSDPSFTGAITANLSAPPLPIVPVMPQQSGAVAAPTSPPAAQTSGRNGASQTGNGQPAGSSANLTPANNATNLPPPASSNASMTTERKHTAIEPQISYLYNKGLTASWFFVPGVIGLVVTLTGTLVSTVAVVREKDSGTLEQLLMTPVGSIEILISKIAPLFVLLIADFFFALALGQVVFNVPLRGSLLLLVVITSVYLFVALSIGIFLATVSQNQRQAILTSFFFNLPLIQLSGAVAPVESMPEFWQHLALLDPLRYYIICLRGILLKGVGLEVLWQNVLILFVFATVFMARSVWKFRRQLG